MRSLALLVSACALLATGCNEAGETEMARGNVLASRHQNEQAVEAYRKATVALPRAARPRELLGHVLFDLHRYTEARAAYQDALRVDPSEGLEARIGLARIDAEDGKLDDALAQLSLVLKAHPDNLYALLSRANVAIRRGHPADAELAITDTAQAMRIDKTNPSVLYTRGCAFIAGKGYDQAEEAFRLLEAAHPGSPLTAYGLARMASAKGDRFGALAHLRDARERASKSSDLLGGWRPDEVRADPAFRAIKDDPEFAQVVGGP